MRGILFIAATILLCLQTYALTALGADAGSVPTLPPVVIDQESDGKKVVADVGQSVEISLEERAGTGFLWQLESMEGDAIGFASEVAADVSPTRRVGGPGIRIFRFTGERVGASQLKFILRRPWEKGAPAKTFAFTLEVASPKDKLAPVASKNPPLILGEGASGGTFTILAGRPLQILLPQRAPGGEWKVTKLEGDAIVAAEAPPNAAAKRTDFMLFHYAASKPGTATIAFDFVKPDATFKTTGVKIAIVVKADDGKADRK